MQDNTNKKKRPVTAPMTSPKTDPQGMYTGVPRNPYDAPIQDADDL
ncbi:MAG: hypothetical protein SPD47_03065 [Oscillospiraceae bacterium]|nr:hypothetical protein [Oscillospiraceae bacterium]